MEKSIIPFGYLSYKKLRNFIEKTGLVEGDTVTVHQINFDDIAVDFRNEHGSSIPIPFILNGVYIRQANLREGVLNQFISVKDDPRRVELLRYEQHAFDSVIYRCGFCGNVVDENGDEFDSITRSDKIKMLTTYRDHIRVDHVRGECCLHEWHK